MRSGAWEFSTSSGPRTGEEDLDRCERALKERAAHRDTRGSGGVTAVEGRDPDDIVVMITYPGPDQAPLHELPLRIYGW